MPRPSVLMVTGAYYPEMSGAGLQCDTLVRALRHAVDFQVLTTTTDPRLHDEEACEGVPVHRVHVDPRSAWSKVRASLRIIALFTRIARSVSIVHLHGFSQKSILLVLLARLTGRPVAIKLTSFGDDDPISLRRRGRLAWWAFRQATAYFAVSPRFKSSYDTAGLSPGRLREIPNGVDLQRFRPASPVERLRLREALGIPAGARVTLCVGFFSNDKRPDVLFDGWLPLAQADPHAVVIFIGATRSDYFEVSKHLARSIRDRAAAAGVGDRVRFVEQARDIEHYYRTADAYVLPSVREGLPNALLEAMATGLPCVATRIEGVTDRLINDGLNGVLVPRDAPHAIEDALRAFAEEPEWAASLGVAARRVAESRYSIERVADQYLQAYLAILRHTPCAA
jgi:glycosyltransferase involved in cell wall biosynthesis